MTKLKAGILSALVIAVAAIFFMVEHQGRTELRQENQALRQQFNQLAQLTAENERLSNLVARAESAPKLQPEELSELLKLRSEVGQLRRNSAESEKLRQENQQLLAAVSQPPKIAWTGIASNPAVIPAPLISRRFKIDLAKLVINLSHSQSASGTESTQNVLLRFFKQNGVDMSPPSSVFVNETEETLWVRSSETNVNRIEQMLIQLNINP